jgi:hypothetical protein
MVFYGWYSLDAYNNGEPEYIYLNHDGQETLCTALTEEIQPPETHRDFVFCGIVLVNLNINSN